VDSSIRICPAGRRKTSSAPRLINQPTTELLKHRFQDAVLGTSTINNCLAEGKVLVRKPIAQYHRKRDLMILNAFRQSARQQVLPLLKAPGSHLKHCALPRRLPRASCCFLVSVTWSTKNKMEDVLQTFSICSSLYCPHLHSVQKVFGTPQHRQKTERPYVFITVRRPTASCASAPCGLHRLPPPLLPLPPPLPPPRPPGSRPSHIH
jgi:hypothetical protein